MLRQTFTEMQTDAILFGVALGSFASGAVRLLGPAHPAVRTFVAAVPDYRDMRDMLTHYEEYLAGGGRLRDPAFAARRGVPVVEEFQLFAERTAETAVIHLAGRHLNVAEAYAAAEALAVVALKLGRAARVSPQYHGEATSGG